MTASDKKLDVLIVGGGFAGMYAIHRLRQDGLEVLALEAGGDVGGTWYWNRYPGARCDVPSLEYSFGFSESLEQEWHWPEVFSAQPDILRYANHVAEKFDLRRHIRFNSRVQSVHFQDDSQLWRLTTEDGEQFEAPYCVMATGCLSVPNTPYVDGADRFKGRTLHTGLWPHEDVPLDGLSVGIIGTGSSGVQAIPELARLSGTLTVFQRTPVYTVPANRKRMREAVEQEFKDNYRDIRKLQWDNAGGVSNFRPSKSRRRGTTSAPRRGDGLNILALDPEARRALLDERGLETILSFADVYTDLDANETANELFRDVVRGIVHDPDVAERLLPKDYGLGCKRQVLDRDYYETFNRSDVELIDVASPVEFAMDEAGAIVDGRHIPLDVLIYATGFDAMTGALLKADIRGRNGVALSDRWADGPVTYLGLQMSGFPNLFTVTGPGSPSVLCNMLVAIEQHVNWIGDTLSWLRNSNVATIEPHPQSEQRWIEHVNEVAQGTMFTAPTCSSWYLGANIPGKPRIFMPYVGGLPSYRRECDAETASGYPGFKLG